MFESVGGVRLKFAGRCRGLMLPALLALAAALPLEGRAQALSDDYHNPERRHMDPVGISIDEGLYIRDDTLLTVGDSVSGLSWTYHGNNNSIYGGLRGYIVLFAGEATVEIGESAYLFKLNSNGSFTNGYGKSGTLVKSGAFYIYTSEDGTAYTFPAQDGTFAPYIVGILSTIQKPNGVKVSFLLNDTSSGSAVTNTGFAMKFDTSDGSNGTIYAVNMLAHSCDSQAMSCNAYDNYLTKTQGFTDSDIGGVTGGKRQITDALGNNWRYISYFSYVIPCDRRSPDCDGSERGPPMMWAFKDPAGYYMKLIRGTSDVWTDPRGGFTYAGGNAYDPSGALIYSTSYTISGSEPNIVTAQSFHDALNHVTTETINSYGTWTNPDNGQWRGIYTRIVSRTNPEGDYVTWTYDARGNITSAVKTGKNGSGLSESFTSGFDTTCSNLKTCNQPNWTKDALGNETDYTYDATHGGVLTVTQPADAGGFRRRTYNTYTSFDTGNGYIYRLTRTETCGLNSSQLTLTACPAVTMTAVTTTDYGTSSTAPYTYKSFLPYRVTQTDGAGSLSVSTTYGYDVMGDVTVVDGPRTDVDDRSYRTYDANRRVVYEIGVLPDASGTPKRTVTHHVYDGAGRELRTESGYANLNATDGSDFVLLSFKRNTYDAAGRLAKTEMVQP